MSTCREAIQHARSGGTSRRSGKEIRFLTFEEAEPFILDQCPSRRTVIDERVEINGKANPRHGKPIIEGGKIVVDTYAEPTFNTKRLGLYDVGVHPAVPFIPTDEDVYESGEEKPCVLRTDWIREGVDDQPEPVSPEAVDEALVEQDAPAHV